MSHPNPSHDRENEYPDDDYRPTDKKKKHKPIVEKMMGKDFKKFFGPKSKAIHKKK